MLQLRCKTARARPRCKDEALMRLCRIGDAGGSPTEHSRSRAAPDCGNRMANRQTYSAETGTNRAGGKLNLNKNDLTRFGAQVAAILCALFTSAAGAVVLDFETLADGRRAIALRSASNEYADFGVTFSGGGEYPGQPQFRAWSSLSKLVANKPPDANRFLISTFRQTSDDAFLDIVVSFLHPVGHAEGDLVFNPSVSATAIAYDAWNRVLEEDCLAAGSVSWIGGRFSFDSSAGIASIVLRTSIPEAQMGLDNLWFTLIPTPVPEPASVGWMLSGIVGIAIAIRRGARMRASSGRASPVRPVPAR